MEGERIIQQHPEKGDPRDIETKLYQTGVMLIFGKKKFIDKGIKCIQKAIVLCDSNYKYWQVLGEAYYHRGSLNPAINCFLKSINLAEDESINHKDESNRRMADCTYSRLRMSDIRLSVGQNEEAASGYKDIINCDETNVAALLGLARAKLQMAREDFSKGLVKSGHSHCTIALKCCLKSIKLKPNLCHTWKLASDCCLILFVHGQKGDYETKIDEKFSSRDEENNQLSISRLSCVNLAQKFLCKALVIDEYKESGCLWHNLGISLYLESTISPKKQRESVLKRSMKCLLKALDCDRSSSQIRNSIAVVAFNLDLVNTAQNFVFTSIRSNLSTSESQFSNLGYMYLEKGEQRLASVAFNRSQAEEPLYARSWFGLALLNEQAGIDDLTYLRHLSILEYHYESQLLYANKVANLPLTKDYELDLVNALDSMTRIINYNPNSVDACSTLGLIYERCNFTRLANHYLEKAYLLCPTETKTLFNKLRQISHKNPKSQHNLDIDIISEKAESLALDGHPKKIANYLFHQFTSLQSKKLAPKNFEHLSLSKLKNSIVGAYITRALNCWKEDIDLNRPHQLLLNVERCKNHICLESVINLTCLLLCEQMEPNHMYGQEFLDNVYCNLQEHFYAYIRSTMMQLPDLFQTLDGCWIKLALLVTSLIGKDRGKLIGPMLALFPMMPELWLYRGFSLLWKLDYDSVGPSSAGISPMEKDTKNAIFCVKKAKTMNASDPNLNVICDILLVILLQDLSPRQNHFETPSRCLARVLHLCPEYKLIREIIANKDLSLNDRRFLTRQDISRVYTLAIQVTLDTIMKTRETNC